MSISVAKAKQQCYWLYRHIVPKPFMRLKNVEILNSPYDPALAARVTDLMSGPEPVYLGRIGGCEYEAASAYFRNPVEFAKPERHRRHLERIMQLAGYFDVDHEYTNLERYLKGQVAAYKNSDALFYCNTNLITKFRHNVFQPKDLKLLSHVCCGKTLMDYTFIEAAMPFLHSFKTWGEGKRVLVVSPFSRSLEFQNARRDDLLVGYRFPEFELSTYTSPTTWSTMDDTAESLGIQSRNWHEERARMCEGIGEREFDIALLSCGSYAAQVGDFIRHELGRSAVYLAGALNVLFNIYGPRFDTAFFRTMMREDTQIEALENSDIGHLAGGRTAAGEAIRAYFGSKPQ